MLLVKKVITLLSWFFNKNSKLTKQWKVILQKNTEPKKILKEFRVNNNDQYKEGNELGLEIFKDKKFLDVRSRTIGKGFAGVMKRWNFGGLRASHGVSVLIDHMDQQGKDRIQEKFSKEKNGWSYGW